MEKYSEITDKSEFVEKLREDFKELHNILNITISILYNPMDETSLEWDKSYAVEGIEELLTEAKKLQKNILGEEDDE